MRYLHFEILIYVMALGKVLLVFNFYKNVAMFLRVSQYFYLQILIGVCPNCPHLVPPPLLASANIIR